MDGGMIQYLPYGGFEQIDTKKFDIKNVREDSEIGHILQVDLIYPK